MGSAVSERVSTGYGWTSQGKPCFFVAVRSAPFESNTGLFKDDFSVVGDEIVRRTVKVRRALKCDSQAASHYPKATTRPQLDVLPEDGELASEPARFMLRSLIEHDSDFEDVAFEGKPLMYIDDMGDFAVAVQRGGVQPVRLGPDVAYFFSSTVPTNGERLEELEDRLRIFVAFMADEPNDIKDVIATVRGTNYVAELQTMAALNGHEGSLA